jgi:hypothetical protein
MTYGPRLPEPIRLRQIDDSNRNDHTRLYADDVCYFLYEYTSGRNYSFSATNSLISNLKKKPSISSQNEIYYKNRDVTQCARSFVGSLNPEWLKQVTLVPVPGSKAIGHLDYDNRIDRMCRSMGHSVDVRNLVVQIDSTVAAHEAGSGDRVTVAELLALYHIDEALVAPPPAILGIVDDVLTAGTHFRAMHRILTERFPGVAIAGLFIARRVFPNDEDVE